MPESVVTANSRLFERKTEASSISSSSSTHTQVTPAGDDPAIENQAHAGYTYERRAESDAYTTIMIGEPVGRSNEGRQHAHTGDTCERRARRNVDTTMMRVEGRDEGRKESNGELLNNDHVMWV